MWRQLPSGGASPLSHWPVGKKSSPAQPAFYGTPSWPCVHPLKGSLLGLVLAPCSSWAMGSHPQPLLSGMQQGVSRWPRMGEDSLTDTTKVGADGPPGTDAALSHALPHRQFQVQEWHALYNKHDDVGHQEATCGHPEPRSGHR